MKHLIMLTALVVLLAACSVQVGYQPAQNEPTVTVHSSTPGDSPSQSSTSASSQESSAPPVTEQESSSAPPETSSTAASSAPSSASSSKPAASSSSTAPAKPKEKPAASSSKPPEVKAETSNRTVEEGYLSSVEDRVFELINEERVENGLEELEYDYDLLEGARIRSKEMYVNNYFAHSRPDGSHWSTVFDKDLGILTVWRGENLAMVSVKDGGLAHQTARYWVNAWINSVDHYANMLKPEYTHAAIGIYYHYDGETYSSYATNLFASY